MSILWCVVIALGAVPDGAAAKVNFKDHVAPILQSRCNSCHNNDKAKGGLNLETFGDTMKGGAGGKVVEPGDADGSRLYELVTHAGEPKMPPKSPKIPDAEIEVLKQWITSGAPEMSGSAPVAAKPKLDFKLDPSAIGKPIGPPAMPEGVSTEPVAVTTKSNAITALAASPWAPLLAISGQKQVLLYNTQNRRLTAVLPFPEGTIHVLKFTRDGGLLLAAGGRGGQSGRAVVWDVKTGKRLFEVGKEYDAVLAADISPDRSLVALGGPSKILRVFSTSDGELVYESKKHTEWVTAVEFSPDGVLLASGDRNGGLVVWEAATGREFYDLRGHQLAITDISWRLDSNLVASSSEDTTVRLWEMQNGNAIKSFGTHGGGALSVRFAKDGRLVTAGRDRVAKLWDQNGGQKRQFEGFGDLATRAVFLQDDATVVAADWSGEVRVFDANDGKRLANLAANPAPVATRLSLARQELASVQAALGAATKEVTPIQADVEAKSKAFAASNEAMTKAQQLAAGTSSAVKAGEAQLKALSEAEKNTQARSVETAQNRDRLLALQPETSRARLSLFQATKLAFDTAASTKSDNDQVLAVKLADALGTAVKVDDEIKGRVGPVMELAKAAQAAFDQTSAQKKTVEASLMELRKVMAANDASVVARTNEMQAAKVAKEAADKLLAAKLPAFQALTAQVKQATEAADALAAELTASNTNRASAMAPRP